MPIREETSGQTKDTLERLYVTWEHLGVPLEVLVEVTRERSVWIFLLRLLQLRPEPRKRQKTKQKVMLLFYEALCSSCKETSHFGLVTRKKKSKLVVF